MSPLPSEQYAPTDKGNECPYKPLELDNWVHQWESPVRVADKHHNKYTADLLALARCRPWKSLPLPHHLSRVTTSLKLRAWETALRQHPDREFVDFLLQGIREGFRIGFNYQEHVCKSAAGNMKSVKENPGVVEEYLANEREAGRLLGPLTQKETEGVHVSPFGVIPKGRQTGKWRLIVDLSSPRGGSVNEGISSELCSLSYIAVDDVAEMVLQLGRGAKLAKFDLAKAYRMVPVHPDG